MRRTFASLTVSSIAFATVLGVGQIVGCSAPAPATEDVLRVGEAIQGGTVDKSDTAVVSIIICDSGKVSSLCSGSLIAPNLILTAHHCVATPKTTTCGSGSYGTQSAASDFFVTTSYDAAATAFNQSTNPKGACPTADEQTWWGVDSIATPGTNICGDDMATLTLSSSINGVCPLIPSVDTDVTDDETYKAVGFGLTSPKGTVAGTRYEVSGMQVQCAEDCPSSDGTSTTQEWVGGSTADQGTCEGDSGGPALDASNRILGTVSRGPSGSCDTTVYESVFGNASWLKTQAQNAASAGGYTPAGWVTGGATSNPANGYCGSASSGSSSSSSASSSSSSSSSGGSCAHAICTTGVELVASCDPCVTQVCAKDPYCCDNTWDSACVTDVETTCGEACTGSSSSAGSSTSATSSSSGTASTTSSTSSTSSSGSSGSSCDVSTGVTACDTCLNGSCCAQITTCLADPTCSSCLTSTTIAAATCDANTAFAAFGQCYDAACASACREASTSTSSSTGTGGSAATGSGTGSASTGSAAGLEPQQTSGCAVAPPDGSRHAGWLTGLAVSLGALAARRRRQRA